VEIPLERAKGFRCPADGITETLLDGKRLSPTQNRCALDDVSKLPHVARPVVGHETVHGDLVDPAEGLPHHSRGSGNEERGDRGNVLPPVSERRALDREDSKAEVKVGPKPPRTDFSLEVAVGGGDDANVNGAFFLRPDPLRFATVLEDEDWSFALRSRFSFAFSIPLNRCTVERGFYLPFRAEFFVPLGDDIEELFTRQTRFTVGLGYVVDKS
jgi:hypothetical protein